MIYVKTIYGTWFETFVFKPEACEHKFCKTSRKKYDIVVCEILAILKKSIKEMKVTSDGLYSILDENWPNALDKVRQLYGIHLINKDDRLEESIDN